MKKTISFFFAIAIIIGCAAAAFLIVYNYDLIPRIGEELGEPTPTPPKDETADWETYRNAEYGFEFKYPPIPSGCEYCKIESNGGFRINTVSLTIEDSEGLSLSEFTDKEMKEFEITDKKEILISGEKGISVGYSFGGMARSGSAVFIKKDDKIFVFNFTSGTFCCGPKTDIIYEAEVYTAMLSTFRFIEKDETADWKTYRNEEYGFEVKYPKDWQFYELDRAGYIVIFAPPGDIKEIWTRFGVSFEKFEETISLEVFTTFYLTEIASENIDWSEARTEYITLAGQPAYQIISPIWKYPADPYPNWRLEYIWTVYNNKAYIIYFSASEEDFNSYTQLIEEMINSFKFIE